MAAVVLVVLAYTLLVFNRELSIRVCRFASFAPPPGQTRPPEAFIQVVGQKGVRRRRRSNRHGAKQRVLQLRVREWAAQTGAGRQAPAPPGPAARGHAEFPRQVVRPELTGDDGDLVQPLGIEPLRPSGGEGLQDDAPTSSGVLGLRSLSRPPVCRQPKFPRYRTKSDITSTSRSVMAGLRWSDWRGVGCVHSYVAYRALMPNG